MLLQTASVVVRRPNDSERSMGVRILFDCGSQRSYVTQEIKELLSLQPESKETMIIKTFGSTQDEVRHCDIVLSLGMGKTWSCPS